MLRTIDPNLLARVTRAFQRKGTKHFETTTYVKHMLVKFGLDHFPQPYLILKTYEVTKGWTSTTYYTHSYYKFQPNNPNFSAWVLRTALSLLGGIPSNPSLKLMCWKNWRGEKADVIPTAQVSHGKPNSVLYWLVNGEFFSMAYLILNPK